MYPFLIETHTSITELLAEKFPDTLILPAFGNNDNEYHDNPIPEQDAPFFYETMFDLWFTRLGGNKAKMTNAQRDKIKETFLTGGYYRFDLSEKVTVLSLNSMYFDHSRNVAEFKTSPIGSN